MSYDIEINIFGKVSNPDAIWDLATAASAEGRVNFHDTFSIDDFYAMLERAANQGDALEISRHRHGELFDDIRNACQAAGLSYVAYHGDSRSDEFSAGISWQPGMREEFEFRFDEKTPTLTIEQVQKAAMEGIDSVTALVETVVHHTSVGVIEYEPGFKEANAPYVGHSPNRETSRGFA